MNLNTNVLRTPFVVAPQKSVAAPTANDCPPTHTADCVTYKLDREIDGLDSTGILGDLLSRGTTQLADANKFFLMDKYKVSGLTQEDNQVNSSTVNIFGSSSKPVRCADDIYLAGDPGVGGKGNNYDFVKLAPNSGIYTVLEDGSATGRKITINNQIDTINRNGDHAVTGYGFVVQDDAGKKTSATLKGGQLLITTPDGKVQQLTPGQEHVIGDPKDPVAKFYYGTVKGAGQNGADEKRLIFESYEKPSEQVVKDLVAKGMTEADARKYRNVSTSSYGFRIPDDRGSFRSPEGGFTSPMLVTDKGVKTYYDAHFAEPNCREVKICSPEQPKVVATNQKSRIWGDPHIEEADGGKYDFNATGTYNVLTDKDLALNTLKVSGPGITSIIKEAGLTVGSNKIGVKADGAVTLDGKAMTAGQSATLANGSKISYDGTRLNVNTPEYNIRFTTKESYQGFTYMNIDVESKADGVAKDGVLPTGLLGETYDEDSVQQTATKNPDPKFYAVNSLFAGGAPVVTPPPVVQPPATDKPPVVTKPPVNNNPPVTKPPVTPPPAMDMNQLFEMFRQFLLQLGYKF
jgi:hypothetical protein